jgi:hypothetical protein
VEPEARGESESVIEMSRVFVREHDSEAREELLRQAHFSTSK